MAAEPNTRDRSHLQRVPPHDLEVEARLLGSALLYTEAVPTVAAVDPGDYYKPSHGHVAEAIRQLYSEDTPVDDGTVAALLRQKGYLEIIGGASTLLDLKMAGGSTSTLPRLVDYVQGYARRRHLLGLLSEGVEAVYRDTTLEGLVAEMGKTVLAAEMATASTWDAVNLAAVLAGEGEVPEPVVLARTDGVLLLYPGKIHALNAEPEAGKSWVALGGCAQCIAEGHHVVYVDFEDDAPAVIGRLLELGVGPADIIEYFHYVRPDEAMGSGSALRMTALCEAYRPVLAVVDGVTEALGLNGWKSNVDVDVAAFFAALPRPLARSGAAVLILDHVIKDRENRGRWGTGSQHKLAGVDGAVYGLDAVKPFSRGNNGMGKLWVNKDRHGKVRPHAAGQRLISEIHFLSTDDGRVVNVELRPPSGDADGPFRPTMYMERISHELERLEVGARMTRNEIRAVVHGKASVLDAALACLVAEGFVGFDTGKNRSKLHHSLRPFRDQDEGEGADSGVDEEPF